MLWIVPRLTRVRWAGVALAGVLLLFVGACAPPATPAATPTATRPPAATPTPAPTMAPSATALPVSSPAATAAAATPTGAGGLALTLSGAAASYAPGEPVRLTLTARNQGSTPLRLAFTSGQRFDASAHDASGRGVWSWSANRSFMQSLGELTLQPGQSESYEIVWEQKDNADRQLAAGKYTLRAWLTAQGVEQRPQVEVTLAAR